MKRNYNLPTAWKDKDDLANSVSYSQSPYLCEIGEICQPLECADFSECGNSSTMESSSKRHTVNCSEFAESKVVMHLANREDPLERRIVLFKCENGVRVRSQEVSENMMSIDYYSIARYSSLVKDFLLVDWNNNLSVIGFYNKYGALWIDRLDDIRVLDGDNRESSIVSKYGESILAAKMQFDIVQLIVKLHAIILERDIDNAFSIFEELKNKYGYNIQHRNPSIHIAAPAGYLRHMVTHIPAFEKTSNLEEQKIVVFDWLRGLAHTLLNKAVIDIQIGMEKLVSCDSTSTNYGTSIISFKPKNLIQLIYLQLAVWFTTGNTSAHYCPVCGDIFFSEKSTTIWHPGKCRMRINRTLERNGIQLNKYKACERVSIYKSICAGVKVSEIPLIKDR